MTQNKSRDDLAIKIAEKYRKKRLATPETFQVFKELFNHGFTAAEKRYLAEIERLKEKLETEERNCLQVIKERDFREEQIDAIADALGDNTEWSNLSDRGENCLELIESLKADLESALEALEMISTYEAYNGDVWPAETAKQTLATLKSKLGRGEK